MPKLILILIFVLIISKMHGLALHLQYIGQTEEAIEIFRNVLSLRIELHGELFPIVTNLIRYFL